MHVDVVPGRELTESHVARWRALQAANPALASPYFCPEFTMAVASVRRDVGVGVLEEAGQIVGFFPFQRKAMGIGKPVGWPMSDCQGVVTAPAYEFCPRELLRACGLALWDFDHLLASQRSFVPYHRACVESPLINLSDGYEVYARERRRVGSELIEKICRSRRKLECKIGPLRFESHTADSSLLRKVIQWKSQQYIRTGLVNVLGFAWTVHAIERIHATETAHFAGMLSVLFAGDEVAGAHMGMRSSRVLHWWLPTYDNRFAKYSPGLILLLSMIEHTGSLGIDVIDLGKGDASYKRRFMNDSVQLVEGSVALPSLPSTLRNVTQRAEAWLRSMPIRGVGRMPGRMVRRLARWSAVR